MEDNKEYKKTLDDEIDWKVIDQLHAATLNFSTASTELKKIYFVLVSVSVTTLIKLSKDVLDNSLFLTLYTLTFAFWFLDSYTYFYQEKLREMMDTRFNIIKTRHKISEQNEDNFTIENNRKKETRLIRSIFNQSVYVYLILLILNTIAFYLYLTGVIE